MCDFRLHKIFCPNCFSKVLYRYGKAPIHNIPKYKCKHCNKQFSYKL